MELSWKSLKNWALSPEDESADLQFYILNKHITQTALSWERGNVLKAVCVFQAPALRVQRWCRCLVCVAKHNPSPVAVATR